MPGPVCFEGSHYLSGRRKGIEHLYERDETGAFTADDYVSAFREARLEVEHDPAGLVGRGLYIGMRP